jgi:hypothetical protein
MAWTQSDLDALRAAIAAGRGVRSVAFGDQQVTFSSIREMLDLLAEMERSVNTPQRYRLASTSKGL